MVDLPVTDDLVDFVRARYDDEERLAQRAATLCGCHPPASAWVFGDESTDGRILVLNDPHPGVRHKVSRRWNGSYEGLFMAEHIVHWDPARVLAEVDAKRKVLELHRPERRRLSLPVDESDGGGFTSWANLACSVCYVSDVPLGVNPWWPCPTVRLLALPYANQPGYRQEWAP
jgi:hypothetical protein